MDPALTAAFLAIGTGAISAFVAYWWGYSTAHTQGRIKVLQLRAQIHEQQAIALDLADSLYRIKGRHITAREAATFNDITNHYRKDIA